MAVSSFKRVQQWSVFSKIWHIYDAKWQNPFESAVIITKYLKGMHKPIYHPLSFCGDHVIVMNTRHIALPNDEWKNRMYYHHTGYAGGASWTSAWEIHQKDDTKVLWKAIYREVGGTLLRPNIMQHLHLFSNEDVPEELMQNVSNQIRQTRAVSRSIEEYSKEEIDKFPKLFDWPKDYVEE